MLTASPHPLRSHFGSSSCLSAQVTFLCFMCNSLLQVIGFLCIILRCLSSTSWVLLHDPTGTMREPGSRMCLAATASTSFALKLDAEVGNGVPTTKHIAEFAGPLLPSRQRNTTSKEPNQENFREARANPRVLSTETAVNQSSLVPNPPMTVQACSQSFKHGCLSYNLNSQTLRKVLKKRSSLFQSPLRQLCTVRRANASRRLKQFKQQNKSLSIWKKMQQIWLRSFVKKFENYTTLNLRWLQQGKLRQKGQSSAA